MHDKIDNVKIVLEEEDQVSEGEHDQNVRRSTRTRTRLVRLLILRGFLIKQLIRKVT